MVNNAPFKAWLKIVKTDNQGQKVTLSNASFKLKDEDGNYVKQKVGLFYKDEWTTDEKGYVVLDNMIESGIYTIEELKTPEGFLIGDDIKVNISSDNGDIYFDQDNQPVIEVTFVNEKPTGHLILNKQFEREEDVAVGGVQFKVTADSDIVDSATGKIIYKKGDPVNMGNVIDGIYKIDKNGKLELNNLLLGTSGARYKVEEVKTLDGYVLLDEPVIFEFDIKDNTTKEYTVEKTVKNKLTETYFSKQDLHGKELKGGEYSVIDAETEEIVDQWTSDGRTHLVKGLVIGKDYIYCEDLTPLGYTYAKDVKFTMSENKQTIIMKDTKVDVNKLDVNDNPVKGATLQVVSTKTKNIVDQWITDGTDHHVEGLRVGETYIIREVKTPEGFVTANEIQFAVEEDEDMSLDMIDKKVIFSKQDAGGEEIEGASMQVIDKETGDIVDEWVSTKDNHSINNLVVGRTYILHEDLAPIGKNLAQDIEFTVSDDNQDQHITMIDTTVGIEKKDDLGSSVKGATLQIVNVKTKNIVDQWITDGTTHHAEGLIAGETYTIAEIKTPEGFETAEPITFTVDGQQDMQLTMTDNHILTDIVFDKVDSGTKLNILHKNFEFTMYSDEKCQNVLKTVEADTNTGTVAFEDLEYGQTIYVKETKAPEGYQLSDEVVKIVIDDQLEGIGNVLNDKYLGWQVLNEYRLIEYNDNQMINVRLMNLIIDLINEGYIFMTEK